MNDLIQFFNTNTSTIIIALIALTVSLVKIIEFLLKKTFPQTKTLSKEEFSYLIKTYEEIINLKNQIKDESVLTLNEQNCLKNMEDLHNRFDENGTPIWYFPRSILENQKDICEILNSINIHQQKSLFILEAILKEIDKIEDKANE